MTNHTYAPFNELFSTGVKPIHAKPIIAKIRDEAAVRPAVKPYKRNVKTHADPNDYTGYETHAFNNATLNNVIRRDSKVAASAIRDEDGDLFFAA